MSVLSEDSSHCTPMMQVSCKFCQEAVIVACTSQGHILVLSQSGPDLISSSPKSSSTQFTDQVTNVHILGKGMKLASVQMIEESLHQNLNKNIPSAESGTLNTKWRSKTVSMAEMPSSGNMNDSSGEEDCEGSKKTPELLGPQKLSRPIRDHEPICHDQATSPIPAPVSSPSEAPVRLSRRSKRKRKAAKSGQFHDNEFVESFNSYEELGENEEDMESKLEWDICNRKVNTTNELKEHTLTHSASNINVRMYICDECNKTFKRKCDLQKHKVMVHKQVMKSKYQKECQFCGRRFKNQSNMSRHRKLCQGKDQPQLKVKHPHTFSCDVCNKAFTQKGSVDRHIRTVHQGMKEPPRPSKKSYRECKLCGKKLCNSISLQRHHKVFHEKDDPHVCDYCGKSYYVLEYLRAHIKKSHGPKEELTASRQQCKCEQCGKQLSDASSLRRHHKVFHSQDDPHICEICGKSYYVAEYLRKHMKLIHGGKSYLYASCASCEKTYVNYGLPSSLGVDMLRSCKKCDIQLSQKTFNNYESEKGKIVGDDCLQFVCEICGKTMSKFGVSRHIKSHLGDRRYTCDVCGKAYAVKSALVTHKLSHSGEKPYSCKACGKTFRTQSGSVYCERKHANDKRYKCETCGKTFLMKQTYEMHFRTHTGEKPYACAYCDKKFTSSSQKTDHERTHTKEYRIHCQVCSKGFRERSKLNVHMKVHAKRDMEDVKTPKPAVQLAPAISQDSVDQGKIQATCLEVPQALLRAPEVSIGGIQQPLSLPPGQVKRPELIDQFKFPPPVVGVHLGVVQSQPPHHLPGPSSSHEEMDKSKLPPVHVSLHQQDGTDRSTKLSTTHINVNQLEHWQL